MKNGEEYVELMISWGWEGVFDSEPLETWEDKASRARLTWGSISGVVKK